MNRFLSFVLLLISAYVYGGNEPRSMGGAESALGGYNITFSDAFSASNNQAGMAFTDDVLIGLHYRSSYLPSSINTAGLSVVAPLAYGAIGGSVEYFGNSLYYEMKAGLAYAMKLADKASIGIQLDYLHSKAQGYDGKHFVTFEFGLIYEPVEEVRIGAHVFNPVKYKVSDETGEMLPIVFGLGLHYKPHPDLIIAAGLEKDIEHPFNFRGGLAYNIADVVTVRGGFSTQPTEFTMGAGFNVGTVMVIDIASQYHFDLGFNTCASFSFHLQKKQDAE